MPDQKRTISIFIETGNAEAAYQKLLTKEKELKDALASATDPKRIQQLNADLAKLAEPLDRAAKKAKGELSASFTDVRKTVDDLGRRLKKMSTEDADYSKVLKQYNQANIELAEQKQKIDAVKKSQGEMQESSLSFGNIFKRTLEYVGAYEIISKIGSALKDLFQGSIEEAMEAEETTARFKATLDNLGKTEVFDRLKNKADEMAAKFKYLDNDEIVGVFEKLIDYGKLTEDQINNLTPVIINFAAKQRIPIQEATDVITKSLEGNGKALKTYGINLSEASTPAERLKIIMTELKDKVDGAAEAFGNTTAGKIAIAKQSYKDLKEEIGNNLLPALNKLLDWVNGAIKGLPLVAAQIKNTLSDTFTFFTQGPGAAQMQKALRLIAQMKETEGNVVEKQVQAFEDKSAEEVHAEIDRINQVIAVKQKYIKVLQDSKYFDPTKFTKEDQKNLDDYEQGVRVLKGTLDGLFKLQDTKTNSQTLGGGDANYDPAAAKEAERKRKEEQKKILDDQKKLLDELHKLNVDYGLINESDYQKEVTQAIEKYNALKDLAHGNADELKKIDESLNQALLQIQVKYAQKAFDQQEKIDAEKLKKQEALIKGVIALGEKHIKDFDAMVDKSSTAAAQLRKSNLEYEIAKSSGNKKFELQKKLLDEEESQAIEAAKKRGESVDAVEQQFEIKRNQLAEQHLQEQIDGYAQYAKAAIDIFSSFDSIKTAKENAELARDEKINDRKKSNLDKRLKAGLISEKEYDRQTAELDKAKELKQHEIAVRQFKRQQKLQIGQALMSGAQAVASTIAALPGPFDIATLGIARAIQIGLMIATTAAQVASIASQKPPEFAHGGQVLKGPSHKQGGIHIEAEGEEAIVNKRTMRERNTYSVSGTPSAIISWLNGLHGNSWDSSAVGRPVWSTTAPAAMNYSGINASIDTRRLFFANGGVVPQPGAASGSGDSTVSLPPEFYQMMAMINNTMAGVQSTLRSLQKDGVNVPITRINDAQARLAAIQDDATMK